MVTDAADLLGQNIMNTSKEACRALHSVSEFVDARTVKKSFYNLIHPDEDAKRTRNIVHTPIHLARKSKSNSAKLSVKTSNLLTEEIKEDEEEEEKEEAIFEYDGIKESASAYKNGKLFSSIPERKKLSCSSQEAKPSIMNDGLIYCNEYTRKIRSLTSDK